MSAYFQRAMKLASSTPCDSPRQNNELYSVLYFWGFNPPKAGHFGFNMRSFVLHDCIYVLYIYTYIYICIYFMYIYDYFCIYFIC